MQSDAEDEFEEILLKARALMQAIEPHADPHSLLGGMRRAPVTSAVSEDGS